MKALMSVCLFAFAASAWAADAPKPAKSAKPAKQDEVIQVEKAVGENAQTVADIVTKRAELKDQTVLVRGKVVKFNPQIMGKNWIHLRDGTGSEFKETNDILVTTSDAAKVGSIVTVKGVVRVNKDFGSGYSYEVLLEDAELQR